MSLRLFLIHGKSQISILTGIWKKSILALMDDLEGFNTSVRKVTAEVVEIARELKLKLEPKLTNSFNLMIKL